MGATLSKESWYRESASYGESYEKLLARVKKNPGDTQLLGDLYLQTLRVGKLREVAHKEPEIFFAWAPQHSKDPEWQEAFRWALLEWVPVDSLSWVREYQPQVQSLLPVLRFKIYFEYEDREDEIGDAFTGPRWEGHYNRGLDTEVAEDHFEQMDLCTLVLWAKSMGFEVEDHPSRGEVIQYLTDNQHEYRLYELEDLEVHPEDSPYKSEEPKVLQILIQWLGLV